MKLKYQTLIEEHDIVDCPAKSWKSVNRIAYRICSTSLPNINWIPRHQVMQFLKDPPKKIDKPSEACAHYCGLSLFEDFEMAVAVYKRFPPNMIVKRKLDHLAQINILETMGVVSKTNLENSHFALFEFENVDLDKIEVKLHEIK